MINFLFAKLRGDEAALARSSMPFADINNMLSGRSVAIVGNARALSNTQQGAQIDTADIVIRINSSPMPGPTSHGTRTDWIAMSTPITRSIIKTRAPKIYLWMTPKRRRIPWRLARRDGFFLYPQADSARLLDRLGNRPTTGLMIIDLVARSKAAAIHLHGFDFFASQSLSGSRTAEQVPHDFPSEKAYIDALITTDTRITLHPMDHPLTTRSNATS